MRTWFPNTTALAATLAAASLAVGQPRPPPAPRPPLTPDAVGRAQMPSPVDPAKPPGQGVFSAEDEAFLDDLTRRGVQFFLDEQHPTTGLMPDRARAAGGPSNNVASTASVGFGLTAICIAEKRGWITRDEAYERCLRVCRFLLSDKVVHERGHFFHFLDMNTGKRVWECEVSNVDTALLMFGVLTARQHFGPDTELGRLCTELFDRVDWPWLLDERDGLMHHGWKPEEGLLKAKWGRYSEGPPLVILLGLGSRTHPLPPRVWTAWQREPVLTYAGLTFVQCPPLFTHQFPQCWFDLRGLHDGTLDYFRNSQLATIAMRHWTIHELSVGHDYLGPDVWGLTASDYIGGYTAWGGPPAQGPIDGTVVPCAAGGSLAFEPRLCVDALKALKSRYGQRGYLKYGFVDAINPEAEWYNRDVIGIDVGPTVVMAENARTGFVWQTFMSAPEAKAALKAAGFVARGKEAEAANTSLVGQQAKEVPSPDAR